MVVGSLVFFDLIFVLTEGGPGDATRVLALDMYKRGFQANLMGQASAIAVILVLVAWPWPCSCAGSAAAARARASWKGSDVATTLRAGPGRPRGTRSAAGAAAALAAPTGWPGRRDGSGS
jgi:hypothetical protein